MVSFHQHHRNQQGAQVNMTDDSGAYTRTLGVEVCLRHNSEIPKPSSALSQAQCSLPQHHGGYDNATEDQQRLAMAVDLYIRSNHTELMTHTQVDFWDHSSDIEISTQIHEILLGSEMTLTKAELIVSLYVKAIHIGQGGKPSMINEESICGYDEVWNCLNNIKDTLEPSDGSFLVEECQFIFTFYHCADEESLVDAFDGITLTSTRSTHGSLEYVIGGFSKETQTNATITPLPNSNFDDLWTSLHFPFEFKSQLLGHAQLSLALSPYSLSSMNSKLLILHGPPGTGKTTISKALAHKVSLHKRGMLIEVSGARIFSKWFGESAQKLEIIFKDIHRVISENQDLIVCVLIDEVESLASSRSQIMDKNEATDAVRVVNTLLTQLDSLKPYDNFIIFATSNLVSSLDDAFLDRADEVFEVSRPNVTATFNIIRHSINSLISEGLVIGDTIPFDAQGGESAKLVYEISKLCHGRELSGRSLTRLPLMTLAKHQIGSSSRVEPSQLPQFLYWLVQYVRQTC